MIAEPTELVRIIYIEKNGKNKIIALFNQPQQVIHLHHQEIIFSGWSLIHRVIPNLLKALVISLILLNGLFYLVTANFYRAFYDACIFTLFGFGIRIICLGLPMFVFYYYRRAQTLKLLQLLGLNSEQILQMEKSNPQNRIYHLNLVPLPIKQSA